MHLPVPVNFIFIGFEGRGNHGIHLLMFEFLHLVDYVIFKSIVNMAFHECR